VPATTRVLPFFIVKCGEQSLEVFTARAAGAQMRGDAGVPLLHRTAGGGQLAANGYIGED
jgi:hypothetical protein